MKGYDVQKTLTKPVTNIQRSACFRSMFKKEYAGRGSKHAEGVVWKVYIFCCHILVVIKKL
jgi:hypothetical protein